jgi:hypothetical protein
MTPKEPLPMMSRGSYWSRKGTMVKAWMACAKGSGDAGGLDHVVVDLIT